MTEFFMLQCIPQLINAEQNRELEKVTTEEEVRQVVFPLNGDSASGSDEFSG